MNFYGEQGFKTKEKGFTLIEMAMVMLVMSIILATLIPLYLTYLQQKQMIDMENKISTIRAALVDFIVDDPLDAVASEVRYPCPASRTAMRKDADFGEEQCLVGLAPGNCSNGVCVTTGSDGQRVLIGTIPTRALDIPGDIMFDPYGNRFTYAISAALTIPNAMTSLTNSGNITIVDEGSTITQNAQFALISHGSDELGAYSVEGRLKGACRGVATGDAINCNDDSIFSYALGHSMGDTPDFYDDSMAFTLADDNDDQYWRATSPSGTNIVNRNPLNVAIGFLTGEPTEKLDVNGSVRSRASLLADADVTANSDVTAGRNVTAGNNVSAAVNVTAGSNVTADSNVRAGASVRAGSEVVAGTDVNAGNNVSAGNEVRATTNVRAQQNIYAGDNFYGKHFFYSDVPSGGGSSSSGGPLLTALCPIGQVLQGVQSDSPICVPAGGAGAVANFNCPPQEYIYGFGADGRPMCKLLDAQDYNGAVVVFGCGYEDLPTGGKIADSKCNGSSPYLSTVWEIGAACVELGVPGRGTPEENYPVEFGGNLSMTLFKTVCVKRFCVNFDRPGYPKGTFKNGTYSEGFVYRVNPDGSAVGPTTGIPGTTPGVPEEFARSAFEVRCTAL